MPGPTSCLCYGLGGFCGLLPPLTCRLAGDPGSSRRDQVPAADPAGVCTWPSGFAHLSITDCHSARRRTQAELACRPAPQWVSRWLETERSESRRARQPHPRKRHLHLHPQGRRYRPQPRAMTSCALLTSQSRDPAASQASAGPIRHRPYSGPGRPVKPPTSPPSIPSRRGGCEARTARSTDRRESSRARSEKPKTANHHG